MTTSHANDAFGPGRPRSASSAHDRLGWLLAVVGDLGQQYDDAQIGDWFDRPRPELGGWAPIDLLVDDWSPADAGPLRVRQLAADLSRHS